MNYLSDNLVEEARQHVDIVNTAEADAMRKDGVMVIDVREESEYNEGAIAGAINMPRSVLEFVVGEYIEKEDREKPHLVYCKTGGRAALAAITMKRMGYTNVHAMHTGFTDWTTEGRQINLSPA